MVRWLWTQKQEFGPPGAEGMVYASSRQRTIILVNRNTWEWDGGSWVQVDDMGPLDSQALIYDTLRRRVISFATKNKVGETWEWDGVSWTQLTDTGPGSRATAMAYDSVRDRVVLFGGSPVGPVDGTSTATRFFADTWEWDGEDWTQQEDEGPAGRLGHAMVYDSARKQTLMFGGIGTEGDHGDTWAWDGESWKLIVGFGPSPRYWHALAYDDTGEQTVLFGGSYTLSGSGRPVLGDTWTWDGQHWIQRQDMGPPARYGAHMAYDSDRHVMVLFGGGGAPDAHGQHPQLHDTWELNQRASAVAPDA